MLFRKCAKQFSILIKEATLLVWHWLMSKKLLIGLALWGILNLLHSRNINPNIIELLESWFLSSSACIRWNNSISNPVNILSGVSRAGSMDFLYVGGMQCCRPHTE